MAVRYQYFDRSAVSPNRSASASVFKVGIFFFIAPHARPASSNLLTLSVPAFFRACHRSHCICILNQVSTVLHPAFSSLIAMSGETPDLRLISSDSAFRLTPRPSAAPVTVNFDGSIQSCLIT